MEEVEKKVKHKFNRFLRIFGPGLITGAADDDPSGIATYSQAGARFGYGQLWTMLLAYPLMAAIQESCARIGAVTGKGLAAVVRKNYNKKILFFTVFLVVLANVINIGADIGAMVSAVELLIPVSGIIVALIFTLFMLLLEIFTSYKTYVKVLKYLALTLLAYPITALIVGHNWMGVLKATVIPEIQFDFPFFFMLTGILGTTISPYMFFWQASEEVEEEIDQKRILREGGKPRLSKRFIKNLRIDNALGMFFSNAIAWFIIITTASVLHKNGILNIESAADAAMALEPLVSTFPNSGFLAKTIFAAGIIGVGLLAIPILAGSASYALSEAFKWKEGLNLKFKKAHGFYGVIIAATIIGLFINLLGFNPMNALIFAAVFNGIASVPLIFIISRIAKSEKIMGEYKSGKLSNALVLITFFVMTASVVTMFATILFGY